MISLKEFASDIDKMVVAHRGASGEYPENTLIAVSKAIEQGSHIVEIDIQITADNQIVVFHDNSLGRTAQGETIISETNYNELKNLDAGSWFDEQYKNERIPLLSEVMDLIYGQAYLMLEIKSYNDAQYNKKFRLIYDFIRKYNYLSRTLFASFDYNYLHNLKNSYSETVTAAIKIPNYNIDPNELRNRIDFDAYICSIDEVNPDNTEYFAKNDIITGVYGVDSLEDFNRIKEYQLIAYGTNYPKLIIDAIDNK